MRLIRRVELTGEGGCAEVRVVEELVWAGARRGGKHVRLQLQLGFGVGVRVNGGVGVRVGWAGLEVVRKWGLGGGGYDG